MNNPRSSLTNSWHWPLWRNVVSQFIIGILLLSLITYAVTLTHPNCQDSATKTFISLAVRWIPWLVCGGVVGYSSPRHWMVLTPVFFLLAYPLISYLWMRFAFIGWTDWSHYWLVLSVSRPLMVVCGLTISGGLAGSLLRNVQTRTGGFALTAASIGAFVVYASVTVLSR